MSDYVGELGSLYNELEDEELEDFHILFVDTLMPDEEDDLVIRDLTEEQAKLMLDAWNNKGETK